MPWPISERGLRGLNKIPLPQTPLSACKKQRCHNLKNRSHCWMKDATCQGYIFACQKYKSNVKSDGGNSQREPWRWKWKNSQLFKWETRLHKLRWFKSYKKKENVKKIYCEATHYPCDDNGRNRQDICEVRKELNGLSVEHRKWKKKKKRHLIKIPMRSSRRQWTELADLRTKINKDLTNYIHFNFSALNVIKTCTLKLTYLPAYIIP